MVSKSSKARYSKSKGGSFENKIFRDLREQIDICYKSIGSGSGDDNGDILTDQFCIECKHYKKLTDGLIDKFWDKIVLEAESNNRIPVLIYKENRKTPRVMFTLACVDNRRIVMRYNEWLEWLE